MVCSWRVTPWDSSASPCSHHRASGRDEFLPESSIFVLCSFFLTKYRSKTVVNCPKAFRHTSLGFFFLCKKKSSSWCTSVLIALCVSMVPAAFRSPCNYSSDCWLLSSLLTRHTCPGTMNCGLIEPVVLTGMFRFDVPQGLKSFFKKTVMYINTIMSIQWYTRKKTHHFTASCFIPCMYPVNMGLGSGCMSEI